MLKVSFALVGMDAYLEIFFPALPVVPAAVALAVVIGVLNLRGAKLTGGVQAFLVIGILSILGAFVAFGTAVLVYAVGTAVIVGVVPMEELRGDLTSVATAGGRIFGPRGVILLAGATMLAFAAVTNAGTFSASRYPLAMSRDEILPPLFSKLNAKGLPATAIQVTVGMIVVIIVFLDPMKIAKLASAFKLLDFSLRCLAVVVMRESRIQEYHPGYRTPCTPGPRSSVWWPRGS